MKTLTSLLKVLVLALLFQTTITRAQDGTSLFDPIPLGPLAAEVTSSGSVSATRQKIWYAFIIEGSVRSTSVSVSSLTGPVDFYVLRDSNSDGVSETLASARASGSTGGSLSLWLDPGVYFVLINYLFDNTEYTLGLSSVSRPDSAGEPNNTLLRAVDLGAATTLRTVSDFVGLPETQDWYRFQIQGTVRSVNVGVSDMTGTVDVYILRDANNDGVPETVASARVSGATGGSLKRELG